MLHASRPPYTFKFNCCLVGPGVLEFFRFGKGGHSLEVFLVGSLDGRNGKGGFIQ